MFSREPNTSKLALIALARQMQEQGGSLIDCQIQSPHLESMGGRFISYKEYIITLKGADAYYTWQERPLLE
jgi:leucyl/phenylalanyl-tRNA--protein transferase